jgi:hypothetical protein
MKPVVVASLALALSAALPAAARDDIKVMSQNQYLGADFTSLLAPPGGDLNAELVRILQQIVATDFPARAQRQARTVARRAPHLVGLQEVWALDCNDFDPEDERGCEDPAIADAFVDYLDETLGALAARGADYYAVAVVRNLDLSSIQLPPFPPGLPFVINGVPASLIVIDRDVILARGDVSTTPVDFDCAIPSEDGCNYQFVLPVELTTPLGEIALNFERGFVAVDATVGDRNYRFVNTHLEVRDPAPNQFQCLQAAELIATLEAPTLAETSLIVVGDLNSSPKDKPGAGILPLLPPPCSQEAVVPPYLQFVGAGYTDVWTLRRPRASGFTCCQAPDLLNGRSRLDHRIDFVWSWDKPAKVRQVRLVGERVADKTRPRPRLWPSDHAGVLATLRFEHLLAAR